MERWFKSEPTTLNFDEAQIDVENGIIRNVVMAQAGPAKGHGYHIENSFIEKLVAYDQKHYATTGLKARFGHPAMSDSTMGKQMGYFKNSRYELQGDTGRAIGDLHLLASADKSPSNPGMREWMLSMAQEATDFVMSSIVFSSDHFYQYDPETGDRVELDSDGWGYPRPKFNNERVYIDFKEEFGDRHLYTDLVEAGAATDSLFSQQFNQEKLAVRVVSFLQENTDILSFIRANPHKVTEMCEKLDIPIEMSKNKEKLNLFRQFKAMFFADIDETEGSNPPENPAEETEPVVDTPAETSAPTSDPVVEALQAQNAQLTQMLGEMTKRIEELEKKPQAAPTEYEEEGDGGDVRRRYACPITLQAMK